MKYIYRVKYYVSYTHIYVYILRNTKIKNKTKIYQRRKFFFGGTQGRETLLKCCIKDRWKFRCWNQIRGWMRRIWPTVYPYVTFSRWTHLFLFQSLGKMADSGWPWLLVMTWKNVHIFFPPDRNLTEKATFLPLPLDNQTQNELFKLHVTHILKRITFWPFHFRSRMLGVHLAETLPLLGSTLLCDLCLKLNRRDL